MLILCAVFALLTVGFVGPCVLDIALTPSEDFDLPSKQTWLIVGTAFWAFGAAAWLLVGRRDVRMRAVCNDVTSEFTGPQYSLWSAPNRGSRFRHLTGPGSAAQRERVTMAPVDFVAPDDNPDFLLQLDRMIQGWREES
jgi:hypothetical protein